MRSPYVAQCSVPSCPAPQACRPGFLFISGGGSQFQYGLRSISIQLPSLSSGTLIFLSCTTPFTEIEAGPLSTWEMYANPSLPVFWPRGGLSDLIEMETVCPSSGLPCLITRTAVLWDIS